LLCLFVALCDKPGPFSSDDRLAPAVAQSVAEAVGEVGGEQVEDGQQTEKGENRPEGDVAEDEREQRHDYSDSQAAPGDCAHDKALASSPALVHLDDGTGDGGDSGAFGGRAAAMGADFSLRGKRMVAISAKAARVGRLPSQDVIQQQKEAFGEDFPIRGGALRGHRRRHACFCCALVIRGIPPSVIIERINLPACAADAHLGLKALLD